MANDAETVKELDRLVLHRLVHLLGAWPVSGARQPRPKKKGGGCKFQEERRFKPLSILGSGRIM